MRLTLGLMLWAGAAGAHPHQWIDSRIEVVLDDQNRAVAVRLDWAYDELNSLYYITDRGLDPDGDGVLTAEEQAALDGFNMNWEPGFPGDFYALLDDQEVALNGPSDWSAAWDGVILRSRFTRTFAQPVEIGTATLYLQNYDPGFYTAYTVDAKVTVTGGTGACRGKAWAPDIEAADQALLNALAEYSGDQDVEADFPAIGKNYAEEARITCAAP